MDDFYEIDFLKVESSKSGDAIAMRYGVNGVTRIHIVDGGFSDTGEDIVNHIRDYYNNPTFIDDVVVTHPDGDHACGLRKVLEEFEVGKLWMLRPWLYADQLIERFARFQSVSNLIDRLKEIYPHIAALEEIAYEKQIPIYEPFQGQQIGAFTVMAPTQSRYFDLIVESDKTPEALNSQDQSLKPVSRVVNAALDIADSLVEQAIKLTKSDWGVEIFSPEDTSAENNMSVVQYANLCGKRILLTGDAGRPSLEEAINYAAKIGLSLPGINLFQIPHHGSRRNLSINILNKLLGNITDSKLDPNNRIFDAVVSASLSDKDHPRKSVIRAIVHRRGETFSTEKGTLRFHANCSSRYAWSPAKHLDYPEDQEES